MTTALAPTASPETHGGGEPERHRIVIVGTGFAGLGTAIRLLEAGERDFVILDRADDVGGTWRDNTYPGCRCDVPSHLYSFSFAPNPDWTETFSPQPQIQAYLRDCAERFGVVSHIRGGHDVVDASWDEGAGRWLVTTGKGRFSAQFLILGTGALVEPQIPAIKGIESFAGPVFHSARWDHGCDLNGKRVAVIGTGASAIQIVPSIQPQVAGLDLYQRTPPWILPHPNRPIRRWERAVYRRLPFAQRAMRAGIYWAHELFVLAFVKNPRLMDTVAKQGRKHIAKQIPDPGLRAKVTPTYLPGCKRILLSNDYYPALAEPNVTVVTDGIDEIRENMIVTAEGSQRPVDAIIFGTGFHVTDNPMSRLVHGRDGHSLDEVYKADLMAHLGTTIPNFPNLFMMTGPNTGLGHTSMVFMIESQINYLLDALRRLDDHGADTFEVRPEVAAAYNGEIQKRMQGTVWTSGCASWYLDARGRNITLWPGFTFVYRRRTRHFAAADYELRRVGARV